MKIAFALPVTQKIEVDFVHNKVLYKKVMDNPKDNGLLAIKLGQDPKRIEMKNVRDIRAFVPHTHGY